ncbi:hypothetical protein RB653_004087 [Dictyostelium firmibasis]|uniref:RING finger protein 17 n=1 Tax=Dictyostelium firmibasis TaxID=79012 RepID=A0AAN7YZR0_9MYCE
MTDTQTTTNVQSQIQPQVPTFGIVRAVNSGDSLVIQDLKSADPPKVEYSLSHLTVPRLGYHGSNDKPPTKDLPFAWESREFLRSKCIGKKVQFFTDYTAPTGKKFISVYLVDDLENSLNKQMIEAGWASLYRSTTGKENKKPEYLNLIQLESEAISKELGIHNKNPIAINNSIRPIHTINSFDLFNKLKGKTLTAVVEQIRNAASYRVTITPSFHTFLVQLSGVQCPGYKKDNNNQMQPEPFALDAELFISKNLLHRDVKLTLDTFDKQGNLFGTVKCAERDVACELLKNGLGTYVPWSGATRSAPDQMLLKQSEETAKGQGLRVWNQATTNSSGSASNSSSSNEPYPKEIDGKVVDIGNNGTIGVLSDENKKEYKVTLASIRVPMFTRPSDKEDKDSKFERYYAYEAKEWLRKRLIGQKVVAKLEFIRPAIAASNLPEKPYYSVFLGKGNVSLGLVEAGLARLTEHKGADNRAIDYEALITAENKAKKKHAGLYSNKDSAPSFNVNDVSSDDKNLKAKAQKILPHIRGIVLPAVVDYVFSAQRVKLFIEKESCMINLTMSGIRAPRREENEELSNQALGFSREHLHQHDVHIQIEDVDKGGNFIGTLIIGNKSFALSLVEMGFASIYDPMNRLNDFERFEDAENKAKASRLNIWKNYDPEEEQRVAKQKAAAEEEKKQQQKTETGEALIRAIVSPSEVYIQFVNNKTKDIESQLASLEINNEESTIVAMPKVGDVVKFKSEHDNKWHRSKITSIADGKIQVSLVDLGERESFPQSQSSTRIRNINHKLQTLPTLVTLVKLASCKNPSNDDIYNDAMDFMEKELLDLKVGVDIVREIEGTQHVLLSDKSGSINGELVRNGLVNVDRSTKLPSVQQLQDEEQKAKSKRIGVWRFGDIDSDDDDDKPRSNFKGKGGNKGGKPAPKK